MFRRPSSLVLAAIMMAVLLWFEVPANAQSYPTTGNLWVGASGSCTRSASAVAYNAGTACSSMQAALSAAQGGDTVMILNGTYGNQSLSSGAKSTAVSFYAQTPSTCYNKPASTATCTGSVLLGGTATGLANQTALSISVDHVHIYGVVSGGSGESRGGLQISTGTSGTDVLVNGFAGKNAFIPSDGVTVQSSEIGGFNACTGFTPGSGCSNNSNCATEDAFRFWGMGSAAPQNDKLINTAIHDVAAPPDGVCGSSNMEPHADLMQVYQSGGTAQNILIDGNMFYNANGDSNMQWGGGGLQNITIQNNYFGTVACCNSIAFGQASPCTGLVFRNNVHDNTYDLINNGGCSGSIDISNNIITKSVLGCLVSSGSVTGGNNIFKSGSGTCGTSAKTCTPNWLNGAPSSANGYDFRLNSDDICAKDAGNTADYAPTDFYGTVRPQGAAPDIGAFELPSGVASVAPPSGLSLTVN